MRLDEVTQLAGGLCLHFANGDIQHMDVVEAWDAVDKLTIALDRRARAMEPIPELVPDHPLPSAKVLPLRRVK